VVSLVVGYGSGGGYDVDGPPGRHPSGQIHPGNPTVVLQTMPGAGSLRSVNYLYNTAPKDGTVVATFARDMPLMGLIGNNPNVRFDPRKLTWLGSSSSYANDAYLLITRKDAAVEIDRGSALGAAARRWCWAGTAEGATGNDISTVLRDALALNIRLIAGYPDSNALFLRPTARETDGRFVGLSAVSSSHPEWAQARQRHAGALAVRTRHPSSAISRYADRARACPRRSRPRPDRGSPNCPTGCRGRSPRRPGLPPDRAKALQAAFLAVHQDAQYLDEAGGSRWT